jgi:ABC-2 type transport system ATP-binding protein
MSLLTLNSISKSYGKKTVLESVSFSIMKAEVFCLLGVNGAGKTTLSSIISTLQPPTSGDILFQGNSIYFDIAQYRSRIGFCPQHPNLHSQLTVFQNLYFSGRAYRLSHQEASQRANELISQFHLEKHKADLTPILSGGYKQRVLIARTLMHNPDLIIFDEPTVGLDPHIRQHLWNAIRALRDEGKSIVLTTHYMDEAEKLSDRICVLDKGVIKLIDTPANLKTSFAKRDLESIFIELTRQEEGEESL